jgi:RHS repeat-associated protein
MLTVRGVGGLPVAAITPSSSGSAAVAVYYHHDAMGSTVAVTAPGSSGAADVYTYSDYGAPGAGTWATYRYAGYRYDNETGLYYVNARYYSPNLGRFLQTDPAGLSGGTNLYAYVGNDPINLIDPTGLCEQDSYANGLSSVPTNGQWTPLTTNGTSLNISFYGSQSPNYDQATIEVVAPGCPNCSYAQIYDAVGTDSIYPVAQFPQVDNSSTSPIYPNSYNGPGSMYDNAGTWGRGNWSANNQVVQFTTLVGTADTNSQTFTVLGGISWGYGASPQGNLSLAPPVAASQANIEYAMWVMNTQRPTWNVHQ